MSTLLTRADISVLEVFDEDSEYRVAETSVDTDPFYSESNLAFLLRGVAALNAGKGVEHDLIEVPE